MTQKMIADNDTLIITDPCYLLREEDWNRFGDIFNYENGQDFLSSLNFGECIIADTGYGDWSNEVTNLDKDVRIGTGFTADAGMVCVVTLSDLTNYGYDYDKITDYIDSGLITVIHGYTGTVTLTYTKGEYGDWAVIKGEGDFNWSTQES